MTTFTGHLTDAQAQRHVDGMLHQDEAAEVEAHLAACVECVATVESYRMLGSALEDLAVPELPLDFTEGVLDRIDAHERAGARERRAALAICASVLLAIVAGLAFLGASSWAPQVSRLVNDLGATGRALRLGAEVLPPVVSALRIHIAVACAAIAFPVLYALSRLMPSPRTELA